MFSIWRESESFQNNAPLNYGTERIFIHSDFAGTIIAPNAEVVIGQSGKNFYGAVYAKSIVVHQNTQIIWVPFEEQSTNTVVAIGGVSL